MIESVKHTKEVYAQIPMDRLWIYFGRKDIQIRIESNNIRMSVSDGVNRIKVKTMSFEEFFELINKEIE